MARRRYSNRRRSGSKRRLEWADLTVSGTPLNDTTPVRWRDAFGDWEGQAGADVQGVTITRILGDVAWTVPNTVAQEYHWLTMGFEVANASDNYELTMPQRVHRLSDPYRDWMYYRRLPTYTAAADIPVAGRVEGWPSHKFDLEIKSKRRFDELSQSLFFWYGFPGATQIGEGNEYSMYAHFRILYMKP